MTKQCTRCKQLKELDDFSARSKTNRNTRSECTECCVWRVQEYKRRNPTKNREYNLRHNWKKLGIEITLEAYTQMAVEQKGACAICGQVPERTLHVDHKHGTSKPRALLCGPCNQGLGSFYERPERLEAAAAYLRKHQAK